MELSFEVAQKTAFAMEAAAKDFLKWTRQKVQFRVIRFHHKNLQNPNLSQVQIKYVIKKSAYILLLWC